MRPPLGEYFDGSCHARSETGDRVLEEDCEPCNLGYARDCPRFPPGQPDAVRFAVEDDDGARIRLRWVIERDWLPAESGVMEFQRHGGVLETASPQPLLTLQASAYVESYLRAAEAPPPRQG